jgi:fatty acid desaturase
VNDDQQRRDPGSLPRQLVWFVGLWLAGVASVGALALLIRWLLPG